MRLFSWGYSSFKYYEMTIQMNSYEYSSLLISKIQSNFLFNYLLVVLPQLN
jgi:hypothetical protein